MRFLFITQYFPPETGAAQNRLSDLTQRLAGWGHDVTVLTAMPNYPTGRIFEDYKGKLFSKAAEGTVRVLRCWIYATKSKSFLPRITNYLSFVLMSFFAALFSGKQDVIVVESPPLFLGPTGVILKAIKRAKLVFNVSDLWPESAIVMGVLRNQRVIDLCTWMEEFTYRHSDYITGQTQAIVDNIAERFPTKRVLLLTNGIDPDALRCDLDRSVTRKKLGVNDGDFVVGYTGLHGLAQGLDLLLQVADLMRSDAALKFVFVGDGPEKQKLMEAAASAQLNNVVFHPAVPKTEMAAILNALDIAVVPLKKLDLFKGALPNKLFEAMGFGVPVVVAVDGEARVLVERAGGGICVPPEDANALANAVQRLRDSAELRQRMSAAGKSFIAANYNRRDTAKKFESAVLEQASSQASAFAVSSGS